MVKKKIKEIFIGSNNKGKLKEIADLLPKSLKIYSNLDFKIPSPIETGTTFNQNSLLQCCSNPCFKVIRGDICSFDEVNKLIAKHDIIIPLAVANTICKFFHSDSSSGNGIIELID